MKMISYLGLTLLVLTGTTIASDEAELDRPSFFASQVETVAAKVTAINHDTREVTVVKDDGEVLTFTAPQEARNLGQVRVGDILLAEYEETISIELMANDGYGPGAAAIHELPGIRLRGLMTIPAPREGFDQQRLAFAQLAKLQADLRQQAIE